MYVWPAVSLFLGVGGFGRGGSGSFSTRDLLLKADKTIDHHSMFKYARAVGSLVFKPLMGVVAFCSIRALFGCVGL